MIADACSKAPCSVWDLLPVVFPHVTDPHQLSFAFSEVFAHVNYMLRLGRLKWASPKGGIDRLTIDAA